ncbi:MAG: orotate phosphoribosyltransferase [Pseudomonadota bacterium]|nr:orotate phosphoribosyltransferase [Pseudomonadota bacterium]
MNTILDIYKETNALQEGHFVLSSGLHSSIYLQSAIVLSYPWYLKTISKNLADLIKSKLNANNIDIVVSPAMGGVVIGSKIGEELQKQSIFLERVDGKLGLRRGFNIKKSSKVIIVEDVITTGKSSKECIIALQEYKTQVLGVFSIVNRSIKDVNFDVCTYSLLNLEAPLYKENQIPESLKKIPISKPGSRFIK